MNNWSLSNDIAIERHCTNTNNDPKCMCINPSSKITKIAISAKTIPECIVPDCYFTLNTIAKTHAFCGDDCTIIVNNLDYNGTGTIKLINTCFGGTNVDAGNIILNNNHEVHIIRNLDIFPFSLLMCIGLIVLLSLIMPA